MLIGQVPFHADSQVGVAMKHVNEELPDVQRRRPEVSAAAALVVERATAKDPTERYQEVGEMIDDLSTALEVEAARAGSTTGEATSVLDAVPPPKRKLSGGARWSWVAIALLVLVGGGACVAVQLISSGRRRRGRRAEGQGRPGHDHLGDRLRPRRATVKRSAGTVGLAVDGNPTGTAWSSRALRHADLRRHQERRPTPASASTSTTGSPAKPSGDGHAHAHPRLGRGDLRRRLRSARRTRRMGRTGRRSRRRRRRAEIELDVPAPPSTS